MARSCFTLLFLLPSISNSLCSGQFLSPFTTAVSASWVLWIMLGWTRKCSCPEEVLVSFPLGICLAEGLLDHRVLYFYFPFYFIDRLSLYILMHGYQSMFLYPNKLSFESHSSTAFWSIFVSKCSPEPTCMVDCLTTSWPPRIARRANFGFPEFSTGCTYALCPGQFRRLGSSSTSQTMTFDVFRSVGAPVTMSNGDKGILISKLSQYCLPSDCFDRSCP